MTPLLHDCMQLFEGERSVAADVRYVVQRLLSCFRSLSCLWGKREDRRNSKSKAQEQEKMSRNLELTLIHMWWGRVGWRGRHLPAFRSKGLKSWKAGLLSGHLYVA